MKYHNCHNINCGRSKELINEQTSHHRLLAVFRGANVLNGTRLSSGCFGWAAVAFVIFLLGAVPPELEAQAAPLKIVSITPSNGNVIVSWQGGNGPFQLLSQSNLLGNWHKIGPSTAGSSATAPLSPSAGGFFAVTTDLTPPSDPTNLVVTTNANDNQLNLSWSASTDNKGGVGLRGYYIYRDNGIIQQVAAPATTTTDSNLSPDTPYSYTVVAVDQADNQSLQSAVASARTRKFCTYTISPTSASAGAPAGNGAVTVGTGSSCAWTASSSAPSWLTCTPASGTGNGTVTWSVTANTSTSPRTGTLTIAGQTFTVTQAGQTPPNGPVNDNFANATVISGTSATVTGTSVGATKEAGEPSITGNPGGASVWWFWTAPAAGSVTIATAGSSFDTMLGVYTGSSVSALTVVAANDDVGGGVMTSQVTFNAVAGTRYAMVVDGYNGASGSINLSVTLSGSCTYAISPTSASPGAAAGSGSVTVTASAGCTWTASSSAPTWLTCTPASGTGNGTVTWSVTANTSTSARSATLTIAGQTFTVTQAGTACTYGISPTGASPGSAAGSGTVTVTAGAGCAWTASSSAPTWLTCTPASGSGNGTVTWSVTGNTSTSARSATLTIAGQTFTVTQAGQATGPVNDYFANATVISGGSVGVTGSNVGATKEAGEPSITGNPGGASVWWFWTAPSAGSVTIATAGSSFDTMLGVYTGSSVSALTAVAANDDVTPGSDRTSLVTFNAVAGTRYAIVVDGYNGVSGNINLSVTLGTTCTYAISPTSASPGAGAGSGAVTVTASAGCAWTASSSATTWLTCTPASGTGNGTVTWSVTANTSTSARSAALTIAGQTFTVTQAGTACTYGISPTGASPSSTAGSGTVTVTAGAGCAWTASSSATTWLTCTPASGNGNGTVTWSVTANTSTSARSATLTIAGQTFTVTQAGSQPTDTTPPNVTLTAPANGSTVSGTISLTATASDNVGVTRVEFYCDSYLVGTATTSPYSASHNTATVGNGSHSYSARACDAAGNWNSASSTVTVNNGTVGQLQWVKTMLGANPGDVAQGRGVATDSSGNVIVAGDFNTTINLGSSSMTSRVPGNTDGFVAKYTPQGSLMWAKQIGGTGNDSAKGVAVDRQGNVIVAGYFATTVDFGGTVLTALDPYSQGVSDMFVAKYSPAGALLWAKQFGGSSSDYANAVGVDGNDNIFVTGAISSLDANFGGIALSCVPGGIDFAVAKLSPAGATLWARSWGGSFARTYGLAVDRSGDVVVTGEFSGNMDIGSGPLTPTSTYTAFLAKYSGVDGRGLWSKAFGGSGYNSGFGVTTDPNTGNVVVTGGFTGTANFGGGPVSATFSSLAVFLAGYDASGNYLWVNTIGGMGDQGNSVKIDASGNLVLIGVKASQWWEGGQWVWGNGSFILSYSLSGNTPPVRRWAKLPTETGQASSAGNGIAFDSLGHVLATGSFWSGTVDFGGILVTSPSTSKSGFVAQYSN